MSTSARNANIANILSRLDRHAQHPSTATLRKAAEACLNVSERFTSEREQIDQNPHLTRDGKKAKLIDSLRKTHARDLRDARKPFDEAANKLKAMRETIKPAQIDETNVVAALERMEIRTFVFNSPSADKVSLLLHQDASPKILDAVLSAPRELSGVTKDIYDRAKTAREEKLYGPLLQEIETAELVLSEANNAAAIARASLMGTVELDQREFDRIMLPIENKTAAPWLLKEPGSQRVVVVEPGAATYQEATPDQLRDGKFYADMQEYQQDRAA
jgi:hypothetical protein